MAAINRKHINALNQLLMRGYTTRKDIMGITVPDLLEMGLDKPRMKAVSELMKAVRNGDSFLAFLIDENSTNTEDIDESDFSEYTEVETADEA